MLCWVASNFQNSIDDYSAIFIVIYLIKNTTFSCDETDILFDLAQMNLKNQDKL